MGGHGGLNILPQKRWNVYNFDNREKVRKDEEEAAREEQLKREQSLRRDAEFRVEKLRQARGLAAAPRPSVKKPSDSNHINLFQGLEDFSSLSGASEAAEEKRNPKKDDVSKRDPKRKREERPVVVSPEDEKYRMGYGVAGKGVKAPWYLSRPSLSQLVDGTKEMGPSGRDGVVEKKKKKMGEGKKTIEQLREERMERERQEKNRERALLVSSARQKRRGL